MLNSMVRVVLVAAAAGNEGVAEKRSKVLAPCYRTALVVIEAT